MGKIRIRWSRCDEAGEDVYCDGDDGNEDNDNNDGDDGNEDNDNDDGDDDVDVIVAEITVLRLTLCSKDSTLLPSTEILCFLLQCCADCYLIGQKYLLNS